MGKEKIQPFLYSVRFSNQIFIDHNTIFLSPKLYDAFTHFNAQVLKATLQLTVFDLAARILEPFEHRPVVTGPEGMVHPPKLYLLPGSPEMRDQELAREKVPGSEQRGW